MKKYWVEQLSEQSKALFRQLAKEYGLNEQEIQDGLDSKIGDLSDNEYLFGFRHCEHAECKEFFKEGFLTEDDTTFCSEMCAEEIYPNLEEKDYGDFIFFTEW